MVRILHTFVFTLLFSFSLVTAQTVWTGNTDSDWFNDTNWSAGVPSTGMVVTIPGTPSGGNFPIYSGSPVIDYTIQNAGTITFAGFVYYNGTIINFAGAATINVDDYFVNAGSVLFDNDGTLTNDGMHFTAFKNGRRVGLHWNTNTELKNDHFVVERSFDGNNFEIDL